MRRARLALLLVAACGGRDEGAELAELKTELTAVREEIRSLRAELQEVRDVEPAAPAPPPAPSEPASAARSVQIESNPSGADVFVADEKVGTTPLAVQIPEGGGELRLEKDGYRPHLMNLRPSESGAIRVDLSR